MTALLDGKVAIITGGTSGIGLASVRRFLDDGAKVVVGDIRDDLGTALVGEFGDSVDYIHTDVTDEESIRSLVDGAVARFGRLDVMFNNAGANLDQSAMIDIDADGFDRSIALLTRSVLLGHKYASRQFRSQGGGGSIVTTASIAGLQGGWGGASYTIAKHAVLGVIRQAVVELSSLEVRSNAIAPGVILTPILARTFGVAPEKAAPFADFLAARLGPGQPLGRMGTADDIAKVAAFLASDLSSFVTGTVIPVDGGSTAITQSSFAGDIVAAVEAFNAQT
ncbi:SDR family NAD(P)-dependent oxidoreductase [Streptomyces mirabilis]|uniref:SDR family NAD(P)-dependent oxidoreductase n=1 Tax=Streptomyces mirabilis TaxID=68239 RepID=UPI0033B2EC35